MRTSTRVAGLVAGALLITACSAGGPPAGAAATVNGTVIEAETVETMVQAQVDGAEEQLSELSSEERNEQVAGLQRQVLTSLIAIELIEQVAADRGLEATDEEVDARWEEEIGFQGGEEQLADLIASLGLTEEQARRQIAAGVLQEKLQEDVTSGIEVTDEEVRSTFDERGGETEQVTASHILVETEEEAEEILTLLDEGTAFEELAEERSIDTQSAANGGSLGAAPQGTYVPEFEEAVWSAEEGEVVGPVETQFGFHVIRVEEFSSTTFEDSAEDIRAELAGARAQEELRTLLTEAFGEAEVEVDSRFGVWDPVAGQVVAEEDLTPEPAAS